MTKVDAQTAEFIKALFPPGTRVELVRMDYKNAPPVGTHGTVNHVDFNGTIFVDWDNGQSLGILYEVDLCRFL